MRRAGRSPRRARGAAARRCGGTGGAASRGDYPWPGMEEWFGIVVIVVSLVAMVVAVIALASSGRTFEQIGRGGLSLGEDGGAMSRPAGSGPAPVDTAPRDNEIRQMLGARHARRAARGQAPIDVEQQLRALTAPP